MTPTVLIGRCGVSSGTSGILLAARSAMNRWRSAEDSGVIISAMKISRSLAMPASNLSCVAACTASTHFRGAGKFFDMPPTMFFANWK
ncbi:Uncharacterised protein [Xylophilus ampelinus]|nr:Uncharacterised protein [Xylophilus ampelinus]